MASRALSPQRLGPLASRPSGARGARPADFYIGYDVYDFKDVGFVSSGADAEKHGWHFKTSLAGNGNGGHEGAAYGTLLAAQEKDALIEYLKTF